MWENGGPKPKRNQVCQRKSDEKGLVSHPPKLRNHRLQVLLQLSELYHNARQRLCNNWCFANAVGMMANTRWWTLIDNLYQDNLVKIPTRPPMWNPQRIAFKGNGVKWSSKTPQTGYMEGRVLDTCLWPAGQGLPGFSTAKIWGIQNFMCSDSS